MGYSLFRALTRLSKIGAAKKVGYKHHYRGRVVEKAIRWFWIKSVRLEIVVGGKGSIPADSPGWDEGEGCLILRLKMADEFGNIIDVF